MLSCSLTLQSLPAFVLLLLQLLHRGMPNASDATERPVLQVMQRELCIAALALHWCSLSASPWQPDAWVMLGEAWQLSRVQGARVLLPLPPIICA